MHLASPDPTPNPPGSASTAGEAPLAGGESAPGIIVHRSCPSCHEVWPIHMMEEFGARFVCKPCKHAAETEAKLLKRPARPVRDWILGFVALAIFIFLGIRFAPKVMEMMGKKAGDAAEVARKPSQKPN